MFIDNFSRSGETFNVVHVYTYGTMKQFNEQGVILCTVKHAQCYNWGKLINKLGLESLQLRCWYLLFL